MDIHAHRRQRLRALIESAFEGSRRSFCDRAEISESRLAQLLSETYRNGGEFGEKVARKLEEALQLPFHYFDQGIPGEDEKDSGPVQGHLRPVAPTSQESRGKPPLDEGIELLRAYMNSSPQDRKSIMNLAKVGEQRALRSNSGAVEDKG